MKRERLAALNRFIVGTLMPEWEAAGWWYEHDDDPPTVPDVQHGFLLERDGVRVLARFDLVEYDAPPDPCAGARDLMADLEASLQAAKEQHESVSCHLCEDTGELVMKDGEAIPCIDCDAPSDRED